MALDYEPGTPAFALNEIALNIRSALEFTERTATQEKLVALNMDVQFPVRLSYRQYKLWAECIEQATNPLGALLGNV